MNEILFNIEIKDVPPIKGSTSKTIEHLDKWRTEASKLMLQYCSRCDDFMTCNKISCELITDKLNNLRLSSNS